MYVWIWHIRFIYAQGQAYKCNFKWHWIMCKAEITTGGKHYVVVRTTTAQSVKPSTSFQWSLNYLEYVLYSVNKLAFVITHAQNVIFDHLIIWVNYVISDVFHCFQDVVLDLSDMSRGVFHDLCLSLISANVLCLPLNDIRITKTWLAMHKKYLLIEY